MKKNKILVFVVIHKRIKKWIKEYFQSINEQTYKDFDLLIIKDMIKNISIDQYTAGLKIKTIDIREKFTPAELRNLGIKYAIDNKYDILFFTDGDDYFSSNRLETSVDNLKHYDFVYNDINIVDDKRNVLKNNVIRKIKNNMKSNFNNIFYCNVYGLSNTAIKVSCLEDLFLPTNVIAYDWALYSSVLLNDYKGGFIPNSFTYYRQHESNEVGMNKFIDDSKLSKGIEVKKFHYNYMRKHCKIIGNERIYNIYNDLYLEMNNLENELSNPKFKKKYMQVINENYSNIFSGWWSVILTINEWRKYV